MKDNCCEMMNYFVNYHCDIHPDPFDCPDNIITLKEETGEYGVIYHDGTKTYVPIQYCPWCGKRLPEVKVDDSKVKTEVKKI